MKNGFNIPRWLKSFFNFYRDGFKNMQLGRTLWLLVIVKLFIMFAILKVFFFPNFLNSKFESEEEKAGYVNSELIERSTSTSIASTNHTDSTSKQHTIVK